MTPLETFGLIAAACLGLAALVVAGVFLMEWVDSRRSKTQELVRCATWLLELKDGPRDAVYEREKPQAWRDLRAALTRFGVEELSGPSPQDGAS